MSWVWFSTSYLKHCSEKKLLYFLKRWIISLYVRIYTIWVAAKQKKNLSGVIASGPGHFKNLCGTIESLGKFCFVSRLKKNEYQCKVWVWSFTKWEWKMGSTFLSVKSSINRSKTSKMARIGKRKNPCIPVYNGNLFHMLLKTKPGKKWAVLCIVKTTL